MNQLDAVNKLFDAVFGPVDPHPRKFDPEATVPQLYDSADDQELRMHNAMQERYQEAVEALKRCQQAGVKAETLQTLCRECGVDINDITVR